MDEPSDKPRKRKPRDRAEYMREYRAGKAKRKPPKRKGKPHGNSKSQRPKEKAPFKYDAAPVIERHLGPGRPTGYNPFRGDELIAYMAGGLCFTAAAAMMGFCVDTLNEWANRHPEFSASKKRGQACLTLYYNRKLNGSIDGAAVTASIFGLKNSSPKEWRDKHEIEHNTAPDDPMLAFLRSINGNVLRPVTPTIIEAECHDVTPVTPVTTPAQIEGPPRPFGSGA
jgi:hypothetical protein